MFKTFPAADAAWRPTDGNPPWQVPSFEVYQEPTLVPGFSLGSSTPTSTRAATAMQIDFEGLYHLVPSGATREHGSRVVRNYYTKTEDLTHGDWANSTITVTAGISDPEGGVTAFTLTATGANSALYQAPTGNGVSFRNSWWVRRRNGTGVIQFYTAAGGGRETITITSSWQRLTAGVGLGTAFNRAGVFIVDSGDAIDVWHPSCNDVTGSTIQTPPEYVSVGVESAPYHGANVDGLKYFNTLNGNTVAANVVTEATGAAINSSAAECAGGVTAGVVDASGPVGLLTEAANTNSILQSNTLGTTWTISNAADMEAVAADAYVSVDGATTMDKLQPKATTAVHSLDQAFTFTAAKYTTAFDFRYVPATPQRWVALILNDGTTTWGASFDLLNGVVGAVSAGATSGIEATAQTNVYRAWVKNTANAAAAAGMVKISLNATDTATLESAARAGTETLGAGMVQHEVGTVKSSRTTTTTVAVTRPADVAQYVSAVNISATAMTIAMEITPSTELGSATVFHFATYVDVDNYTAILSDGTDLIARKRIAGANTDATIAFTRTVGTAVKAVARFDTTNGIDVWLSGTKGTGDATLTASQIGTNWQVGGDGNGAGQDYCMHRNKMFVPRSMSDEWCRVYST